MNDVEKLIAFINIRSYLNQNDQNDLLKKLEIDENSLNHRLRGFNVETEFFVIIHLLNSCKDILSFDEGTSVLTKSYSPDSCLVLKNNEKLFVEIKSKKDFQYKISNGNLEKRISFANEFGFKLYFAVKLENFWGLYSSDYLQSKKGKLTFPDDYNNSDFEKVLGSKIIIMPKGIKVESYYSTIQECLVGIKDRHFGNLFKYKFFFNEKLIFEVEKANETEALISIILESLHDMMSKQYRVFKDLGNGVTLVTEILTDNTIFYDYNFLLAHIYHTQSAHSTFLDTTSFYKSIIEQKGKTPITKELLFQTLELLQKEGVPIIISTLRE